jgi:multiple sugar transport system substrate-binding protein
LPNPRRILWFAYVFGGSVWDFGRNEPNLTDSNTVRALAWLQSFTLELGSDTVAAYRQNDQSLPGKTFPLLPVSSQEMVGRYIFVLDGQWRTREIDEFRSGRLANGQASPEFGVCAFPTPDGGRPDGGWVNGNVFIFPRRAANSQGAWEFAKFWLGYGNPAAAAETCVEGGWIPVSAQVVTEPQFQSALQRDSLFGKFVELAGSANQLPTPMVRGAGYLQRAIELSAERVSGDATLDPLRELARVNDDIRRYLTGLSSPPSEGPEE